VSAAGGAHLALVPPTPDAVTPPPFDALARSSEAKRRRSVRARHVASGMCAAGCALLAAGPLLAAVGGAAWMVAMFIAGVFLLPGGGVALFCFALLDRTRAAVRALMAAVAMLAATAGLMGPARRVAIELHVAANQQVFDALAAEIRAGFAAAPRNAGSERELQVLPEGPFGRWFRPLEIERVVPVDGGLLFTMSMGMGYTLLYADGVPGPALPCQEPAPRFIGGRWYEVRCVRYEED
jgi:hypothetical protein